jgi:hypothetical protein
MLLGCPPCHGYGKSGAKKQRGALGKGLMPFGSREFIWILPQLGKDDAVLVRVKTLGSKLLRDLWVSTILVLPFQNVNSIMG